MVEISYNKKRRATYYLFVSMKRNIKLENGYRLLNSQYSFINIQELPIRYWSYNLSCYKTVSSTIQKNTKKPKIKTIKNNNQIYDYN